MKNPLGFIGLGIMGKPMARNLLKAGYDLIVYDINQAAVAELSDAGAVVAKTAKEVAQNANIVFTMLPNSPQVKDVVLGAEGILQGATEGSIIVDMSSIAPKTSQELFEVCKGKNVIMLDAPVSGGEPKAINGTLSIMVGGPSETFEKVREILLKMGTSVVLVGEIGSGNVTKLANQMIVALNIAAMSEALVLATKAGVDPEKVFQAIRGGLAGSTVLEAKAPMVLNRNFNPGFRIELHIKDLLNALDTAHEVGVPVPLTAQILEIMQALKVAGNAANDHSGIVQFYEKLAGIEVGV